MFALLHVATFTSALLTADAAPSLWTPKDSADLAAWFKVATPKADEPFGDFVVRVAKHQLGKPYALLPESTDGSEALRATVQTFECQSFVESSLSVARCAWAQDPNEACFFRELESFRYRGGTRTSFSGRLHYFSEWLHDNLSRGRLSDMTTAFAKHREEKPTLNYISLHASKYVALSDPKELAAMKASEASLSERPVSFIAKADLGDAPKPAQTGDVVAIVTSKPGVFIGHTGFVVKDAKGIVHLLHASSQKKRVLETAGSLANYLVRTADRRGVMVMRPLTPVLQPNP